MKIVDHCFAGQDGGSLPPSSLPSSEPLGSVDAIEAVRIFSQTGSLVKTSAALKCSLYELKKLTRTEWWQREFAEMRAAEAAEMNVKLTKILDQTFEAIEERLASGDFIMTAGGLKRVPLSAAVLTRIADTVFEKRQLIRNQPTEILDHTNSKLAGLARQLRALGAKNIELLDQEVIDIPLEAQPSQERVAA